MAEIGCDQFSNCLIDFVDGDLDQVQHALVKDHLEKCPLCEALMESYVKTIFILQKVNQVAPPKDMAIRLRQYLQSKLPSSL